MKITITIPDKDVKQAILNRLENDIYEEYDVDVIKKAKIPGKAAMAKQLMENSAFISALEKRLVEYGEFDDALFEAVYDIDSPTISGLEEKCSKVYNEITDAHNALREEMSIAAREAEDEKTILRLVKALERSGYKLVKA
jgi:hypothetical protein